MDIGNRVREERERLALSQTDFGEAAGVGRQSQFNYESGKRVPDADYLAAVAQMGVDVRYVITGARDYVPPPPLSSEEQVMLGYFRSASAEARRAALGALVGAAGPKGSASMVFHGAVGTAVGGDVNNLTLHPPAKPKR